jgi:hypothetical protein
MRCTGRRFAPGVSCFCLLCLVFLGASSPTAAGRVITLGNSGWQAIFDPALDPYVDLMVDQVTHDTVYLEKSAEFRDPPNQGVFPAIAIVFQQIAANAVPHIVITDEIVTNHTGANWTDFHFNLLDHNEAKFDHATVFNTDPFSHQQFVNDDNGFWVDGFGTGHNGADAVIPNNGIWFPHGRLIIDATPHANLPFALFSFKEQPTPEPASALLLLAGALFLRRR